jgi:hypothetical protein
MGPRKSPPEAGGQRDANVLFTPNDPAIPIEKVLGPAISAGLPVALWVRGLSSEPAALRAALTKHFWPGEGRAIDWPRRIRELRRHHAGGADCACGGFALLWDNPMMQPPLKKQLQSPS